MVREEAYCYTPGDSCERKYKNQESNGFASEAYLTTSIEGGGNDHRVESADSRSDGDAFSNLDEITNSRSSLFSRFNLLDNDDTPLSRKMDEDFSALLNRLSSRSKLPDDVGHPSRDHISKNRYNVDSSGEEIYDIRELQTESRSDRSKNRNSRNNHKDKDQGDTSSIGRTYSFGDSNQLARPGNRNKLTSTNRRHSADQDAVREQGTTLINNYLWFKILNKVSLVLSTYGAV